MQGLCEDCRHWSQLTVNGVVSDSGVCEMVGHRALLPDGAETPFVWGSDDSETAQSLVTPADFGCNRFSHREAQLDPEDCSFTDLEGYEHTAFVRRTEDGGWRAWEVYTLGSASKSPPESESDEKEEAIASLKNKAGP